MDRKFKRLIINILINNVYSQFMSKTIYNLKTKL